MRIAMDARGINWYRGSGIGTYTDSLLCTLLNIDKENYYHIYWSGDDYDRVTNDNSRIIMTSRKHHRFFQQSYIPGNLAKENIDIYHVPQNGIGLCSAVNCRKVITIHDLIPYIMPETVGRGYLLKFLKEVPNILEISDGVITVSEWSKRDILKFFPVDENKIFVTPLAADIRYKPLDKNWARYMVAKRLNIKLPFLLYVGGFSPRKNVKSLIMAFSNIINSLSKEFVLVIAGSLKDDGNMLKELCDRLKISSNVFFTGFVEEDFMPILYSAAEVFVYPSLYEGFGLPPLEAMSCGTPVITSNVSSIPEIVGDAGILIDPYDTSNLVNALGTLLENEPLKLELIDKGLNRAKLFSWEKTAEKTLEVYKKIIEIDKLEIKKIG
ncbi:glycosyltransferase family 4 protein [Clostridium oryzae]|uniref:Capsular glucan synthase n=1 Tax=Clostridium oryzae TaxID=1450648 RepID=A0A1V4ITX6_9CLOT|nr:glycosyltransferase family 1 protein [Clostridium oryzae]OPJ63369.1 capsular glucan synthase [Clostridium oryzae]